MQRLVSEPVDELCGWPDVPDCKIRALAQLERADFLLPAECIAASRVTAATYFD